ncbi:MAG: phage exclusion protein Lit family protein [Isosphaeraceae bacterium]
MKGGDNLPEFLKRLPVSVATKERLASLGTEDPLELLGMIRAARPELERLIGAGPLAKVVEVLESMSSQEDLAALQVPPPKVFLGARTEPAPTGPISSPFAALLREQDRVVAAAKAARATGAPSERLAALEQQLVALKTRPEPVVPPRLSPVNRLLPYVSAAPYRAAPERAGELHKLVQDHGIRLTFDPSPNQVAEVNLETGEIRFGLPFAERLWAASYAYLDLIRLWQQHGPGAMIEIPEPSRRLLEWEFRAEKSGTAEPLPSGVPVPEPGEPPGADGYAATEFFLIGAAWVLLHEVGHLVCKHRRSDPPVRWIPREFEADDWASHWMLDRWREYADDDRVFVKRALAGTLFLGHIAAFESHGPTSSVTHPNPAERLLHFLDRFVPRKPGPKADAKELPWVAAMLIVECHFQAAGKPLLSGTEFVEPRDALVSATVRLSSKS